MRAYGRRPFEIPMLPRRFTGGLPFGRVGADGCLSAAAGAARRLHGRAGHRTERALLRGRRRNERWSDEDARLKLAPSLRASVPGRDGWGTWKLTPQLNSEREQMLTEDRPWLLVSLSRITHKPFMPNVS